MRNPKRPMRIWAENKYRSIDITYQELSAVAAELSPRRLVEALRHDKPTSLRDMANKFRVRPGEVAAHLQVAKAAGQAKVITGGWIRA